MSSSFLVRRGMLVLVALTAAFPLSPVPAAAQSQSIAAQVALLGAEVAALQQQVAVLQSLSQPLNLSVDCAAGQTVGAALAQSQGNTGPVTITISGTCVEQVPISRDDVTIQGSTPTDGLQAPNPATDALINVIGGGRINLSNLTLTGGQRGVRVTSGGSFFGNHLTVTGTQDAGIEAGPGGNGTVSNSSIDHNASRGVTVQPNGNLRLRNCDVSNNGFIGVNLDGGSIDLVNSTVSANIEGIQSFSGAVVRLFGSTVKNNTFSGLDLTSTTLSVDQGSTISGNNGDGIALGLGSVALLKSGTISANGSDGVLLLAGSDLELIQGGNIVIQANHGNGILVLDTGVVFTSQGTSVPVQITQNTGWGVLCAGPPAVAQISTRGQPALTATSVFGNTQGQINCPGSPLVP